MTAKQYVNVVTGAIRCSKHRKKEIRKQLLTDIQIRQEQGEELKDILTQMGKAKELAEEFNETVPPEEQSRYKRSRMITVTACVAAAILLIVGAVYWMLPKSSPIEASKYFDQKQVEEAMKKTVELFDAEESEALIEQAIPEMQKYLSQEAIWEIKSMIGEDWGERKSFGAAYLTEISQENTHYAVGEITVTYEKVSVIFRLTYDQEMRLAGLYVR